MEVVKWVLRWVFRLLPLAVVVALLHFYLPGHDVVRIVGTEVNRMDRSGEPVATEDGQGTVTPTTRDVRFINTVRPNGEPSVYRNEDTDWGFPWYFKFSSGNLQASAQDLISSKDDPEWAIVTHYGWRIEIFSLFPNAVDIEPIDGPEVTIIPWFNIVFLALLAILLLVIWRAWRNFLERLELDSRFENASNGLAQVWRWVKANFRDLTGRPQ